MAINVKGHFVVNQVVEKSPPPPVAPITFKWNSIRTVIKPEPVKQEAPAEQPSTYHHQVDGDLHKLINKKSDYLVDMLDFDSNK